VREALAIVVMNRTGLQLRRTELDGDARFPVVAASPLYAQMSDGNLAPTVTPKIR
jgi:hypothetical protein